MITTSDRDVPVVLAAVRALSLACRFDEAQQLLSVLDEPPDASGKVRMLIAKAEVAHRSSYVSLSRVVHSHVADLLAGASALLVGHPNAKAAAELAWDVRRLELQHRYTLALRHEDGTAWFGPDARDPAAIERFRADAEELLESAADDVRRGWAHMLVGWISDNIVGDRGASPNHYLAALAVGRAGGDFLLVFEAQRHLGDHAHDDGDHHEALARWEESTEAAARAGHVSGVLAQQILLAVLAQDAGDERGARALAREVKRWAAAIGADSLSTQAAGLQHGIDPTRPPEAISGRPERVIDEGDPIAG